MKNAPHTLLRPQPAKGFTLIELLTVIAIIGILAAIIIPTVGKVREQAKKVQTISRIRECGTALQLYASENKDRFLQPENVSNKRWALLLFPYIDPTRGKAYEEGRITGNDVYNSGHFKCPTVEVATKGTGEGVFLYNLRLEERSVAFSELSQPSMFPVLVTAGAKKGIRLFASGTWGPYETAKQYGHPGPYNDWGPAPNYGKNAIFLFGDWHVAAKNVCDKNAWPWNDGQAFNVR